MTTEEIEKLMLFAIFLGAFGCAFWIIVQRMRAD